jgi:hypothetical protein
MSSSGYLPPDCYRLRSFRQKQRETASLKTLISTLISTASLKFPLQPRHVQHYTTPKMNPTHAFATDRTLFEAEMESLITGGAAAAARNGTSVRPSKRLKTESLPIRNSIAVPSKADEDHVHTSRQGLVRSDATAPTSGSSTPTAPRAYMNGKKPWQAPSNAVRRQWASGDEDVDYESMLEFRRKEKLDNVDRYVPNGGKHNSFRTVTATGMKLTSPSPEPI